METASTDSDGPGDEMEEDGEESDDEDEDDSDKEEEEENGNGSGSGAVPEKLLNHQKPENAILVRICIRTLYLIIAYSNTG